MKKMIYDAPLGYFGIIMNGQKVKVGFWNIFADKFEDDLPIYEGCMGDLMCKAENQKMWNGMKMKTVNHLSAEGDVVVIGVDRYDV